MNKILTKKKNLLLLGWTVVFLVLFLSLQQIAAYHFFFMEEWQTFFYDSTFISSVLFQPGGFAQLAADYLIQFFCVPYCGALIFAIVLTLSAALTGMLLDKLAPQFHCSFLGLLPVITFLFLQLNINYQLSGTLAYLLCVASLYVVVCLKSVKWRVISACLAAFLLFVLAGPVAVLFSVSVLLLGLFLHFRYSYFFLIPSVITVLSAVVAMRLGMAGEYKYLLLPDGYFSWLVQAGNVIYQPWIVFGAIFYLAILLHYAKKIKKPFLYLGLFVQVVLVAYFTSYSYRSLYTPQDEFFKELSYYVRTEQWAQIIQRTQEVGYDNYLYQNCRNLALAEQGKLADELFHYSQDGLQSIYLTDIASPYISMLVGDVYYNMGALALAQRRIFEANESTGNTCGYAFQRLVEINLAYGAYPVAEKYLALLEKTLYYKNWAKSHRRFLNNDRTVIKDSLLGAKRRCIFPENCFAGQFGIDADLKHIIDHNPSHRVSMQYLGTMYLLICDLPKFKEMVERYYGTSALPVLPKAFQEGMVAAESGDTVALQKYHIPETQIREYQAFCQHQPVDETTYWNYLLHYRGN